MADLKNIFQEHFLREAKNQSKPPLNDRMKTLKDDGNLTATDEIVKRLDKERKQIMKDTEKMIKEKLAEKEYDEQIKKQEELEQQLYQEEEPPPEEEMVDDGGFPEPVEEEPLDLGLPNDYREVVLFDKFLDFKNDVKKVQSTVSNMDDSSFEEEDKILTYKISHKIEDLLDKVHLYIINSFARVEYDKNIYVLKLFEKELFQIITIYNNLFKKYEKTE